MQKFIINTLIALAVLFSAAEGAGQPVITTGSLFKEMTDLNNLAKFPELDYKTIQFSSYDHRSILPGGPDWFANSDGFGGEPIPNFEKVLKAPDESGIGEYLIADIEGPGAIVRLWTAAISGKIRVYIDDVSRPVYEGEADPFFRRSYDSFTELKEINRERFNKTIYQRDASYTPFTFNKRLRMIWIGNLKEIHFYQIGVRLYPEGTSIQSFSPGDITEYSEIIDRVTLALSDPEKHLEILSKEPVQPFSLSLRPSEKKEVFSLKGPGAIGKLTLRIQAKNIELALRQTVLHIICDDFSSGQVQSPAGDFFGAAPGINPYKSLPFTVVPDGTMICRYVMPFEHSLKIELENNGNQDVIVDGSVQPVPYTWDERSMHFRARWRANHNITASNKEVQDLPFLLAHGKGVYVGTVSYLLNPSPVPTPWGNWWGEGDEKVFIDGDTKPSIFGTGSEDYYNYSWSSPDIFYFPYCGQPRNDGPGNRGFVTNFRWHILDPLPFKTNIRFYMELYSHERTPGLSYARIGYHYAFPGVTDDHLPISPEDLRELKLPENWQPVSRFGARNSVIYAAEDLLTNNRNIHLKKDRLWAGGTLCLWSPENPGEKKDFKFTTDSDGEKRIYITAAMSPQSGKVTVFVDNQQVKLAGKAEILNLHCDFRLLLRNFPLEPIMLKAGEHILSLEYRGAAEQVTSPEIGIDFIWIQNITR